MKMPNELRARNKNPANTGGIFYFLMRAVPDSKYKKYGLEVSPEAMLKDI
jgi:hypothetical protein